MPTEPRRRRPRQPVITETVLGKARALRRRRASESQPSQLFTPAEPPPGVLPQGGPKLAQDEAIGANFLWASNYVGGVLASQYAEGMVWPGYAELALLALRAENRVVAETIAGEMTRAWITLKSGSDKDQSDKIKDINNGLDKLKTRQVIRRAVEHDGLFGRGHIYLDCCDPDDDGELRQSIGDGHGAISQLKITQEKKLKALRCVEPIWTYPNSYNSQNPLRSDWYRPETWFVMGKEVHRTRLLTVIGREVPDVLKPAYAFGGLSTSQMIKPYVDNWLKTRQAVTDLVQSFTTFVLGTDLGASLQLGGDSLFKRIELFNTLRDNSGLMVINSNTKETFQNVAAPLGGLEQIQAQSQEHMAAVTRIPIVKLLGIQPAGLNASSEGELRSFYDWIMVLAEALLREPLTTIINFVQLSIFGKVDDDITFDFNPAFQLDEREKAEVDARNQQIDSGYIADGVVSPEEVRKRLANDRNSPYQGLDLDKTPAAEPPDIFGGAGAPGAPGQPGGPEKDPEGLAPRLPNPLPELKVA